MTTKKVVSISGNNRMHPPLSKMMATSIIVNKYFVHSNFLRLYTISFRMQNRTILTGGNDKTSATSSNLRARAFPVAGDCGTQLDPPFRSSRSAFVCCSVFWRLFH